MKVLFDHPFPFALAHGGFQTQIEESKRGLEALGVEVEFVRWWDDSQKGDLIHYFGAPPHPYIESAHAKSIPVVLTNLFTATCNRPDSRLRLQGSVVRSILKSPARGLGRKMNWSTFAESARNIVGLKAERRVLELVYGIAPEKVSVVPLGLPERFLKAGAGSRAGEYLVCVGTITQRKNSVPLAKMARQARVPILFLGKPYSESDSYWKEFNALIDNEFVRHQGHVADPAALICILQNARGAVIMSWFENWCLAAHEAAACGLPLLLPTQKWSLECFGNEASYFPAQEDMNLRAQKLREFYERAASETGPRIKLYSWVEVAERLRDAYQQALTVGVRP